MTELTISDDDTKRVEHVWATVFRASGKVLLDAKVYGFEELGKLPPPNIHDMVRSLKVLGAIIELVDEASAPYDQQRQLLNAKAQITNMEKVAAAVVAGCREDFEAALIALERQAAT